MLHTLSSFLALCVVPRTLVPEVSFKPPRPPVPAFCIVLRVFFIFRSAVEYTRMQVQTRKDYELKNAFCHVPSCAKSMRDTGRQEGEGEPGDSSVNGASPSRAGAVGILGLIVS